MNPESSYISSAGEPDTPPFDVAASNCFCETVAEAARVCARDASVVGMQAALPGMRLGQRLRRWLSKQIKALERELGFGVLSAGDSASAAQTPTPREPGRESR